MFPFSLLGREKQWFYLNRATVDTWEKCSTAFHGKFFPLGKTNALRGKISSFQQSREESIPEAWERLQEYILACPHHGMDDWLIIQNFYNGLNPLARDHIDAAAGGAFFSLTVGAATQLIEKMVSNQGWSEERLQPRQRGVHTLKETDMLAAKLDMLMKRLDDHTKEPQAAIKAVDARMTCEVCGCTGHSGNDCPETQEEAKYMNNGYRPQGGQSYQPRPYQGGNNGGYNNYNSNANQPSFKELVLGQVKINEAINKKLAANDKTLESIHAKLEGFSSAFKNQLSFNKMLETQLAQIAAAIPPADSGRILGQPDIPRENVHAVATRGGKGTQDPPNPNTAGKEKEARKETAPSAPSVEEPVRQGRKAAPEFVDTNIMPFPPRNRKPTVDEQFTRFVEVIQKLHINIPLLDAMQVPTYARYLKDILSNKRPMPTAGIVKLTEECSSAILQGSPEKKKDPGYPTITCSIEAYRFDHALCDLGASVSVMPKAVFDKLHFANLTPTPMQLQLADSSIRLPAGIAEDVPVNIRGYYVPVDFVVLEMDADTETSLILGRPFLSTTEARIDVGAGQVWLTIDGGDEKFEFQPRREQCSMIKIRYGPNPRNIKEVEVTPPKEEGLVPFMKEFLEKEERVQNRSIKQTKVKKKVSIPQPNPPKVKKPPMPPQKKTKKKW